MARTDPRKRYCPRCDEVHFGGQHTDSRVCPRCGKTFQPRHAHTVHCSKACAAMTDPPKRICKRCGRVIKNRRNKEYCDAKCRGNTLIREVHSCVRCGENFLHRSGAKFTNEFCSMDCYHAAMKEIIYPIPLHYRDIFTRAHKRVLLERANGKCEACGATERLEFDHIVPRHQGGKGTIENGQVLCRTCHLRKTREQYPRLRAA